MLIQAKDGRYLKVRRRWFPWRPKPREFDSSSAMNIVEGADDPVSCLVLVVVGIVLTIFGGIILTLAVLASEFLLLFALLIPLFAIARWLWILPWIIEVSYGDETLGTVSVRGWGESGDKIQDLVSAYLRGENPFRT